MGNKETRQEQKDAKSYKNSEIVLFGAQDLGVWTLLGSLTLSKSEFSNSLSGAWFLDSGFLQHKHLANAFNATLSQPNPIQRGERE